MNIYYGEVSPAAAGNTTGETPRPPPVCRLRPITAGKATRHTPGGPSSLPHQVTGETLITLITSSLRPQPQQRHSSSGGRRQNNSAPNDIQLWRVSASDQLEALTKTSKIANGADQIIAMSLPPDFAALVPYVFGTQDAFGTMHLSYVALCRAPVTSAQLFLAHKVVCSSLACHHHHIYQQQDGDGFKTMAIMFENRPDPIPFPSTLLKEVSTHNVSVHIRLKQVESGTSVCSWIIVDIYTSKATLYNTIKAHLIKLKAIPADCDVTLLHNDHVMPADTRNIEGMVQLNNKSPEDLEESSLEFSKYFLKVDVLQRNKKAEDKLVTIKSRKYRASFVVTREMTVADLKVIVSRDCAHHVILPAEGQSLLPRNKQPELADNVRLWEVVHEGQELILVVKDQIPVTIEMNGITLEHHVYDAPTVLDLKVMLQEEQNVPLKYQFMLCQRAGEWRPVDDKCQMKELVENKKITVAVHERHYQANITIMNNVGSPFILHIPDARRTNILNVKEQIAADHKIPVGHQHIYRNGVLLHDESLLVLAHQPFRTIPALHLSVDQGRLQENKPHYAFLIMPEYQCIHCIKACSFEGKIYVDSSEFLSTSREPCKFHLPDWRVVQPAAPRRKLDIHSWCSTSSTFCAENPSESDATTMPSSTIFNSSSVFSDSTLEESRSYRSYSLDSFDPRSTSTRKSYTYEGQGWDREHHQDSYHSGIARRHNKQPSQRKTREEPSSRRASDEHTRATTSKNESLAQMLRLEVDQDDTVQTLQDQGTDHDDRTPQDHSLDQTLQSESQTSPVANETTALKQCALNDDAGGPPSRQDNGRRDSLYRSYVPSTEGPYPGSREYSDNPNNRQADSHLHSVPQHPRPQYLDNQNMIPDNPHATDEPYLSHHQQSRYMRPDGPHPGSHGQYPAPEYPRSDSPWPNIPSTSPGLTYNIHDNRARDESDRSTDDSRAGGYSSLCDILPQTDYMPSTSPPSRPRKARSPRRQSSNQGLADFLLSSNTSGYDSRNLHYTTE